MAKKIMEEDNLGFDIDDSINALGMSEIVE